MDRRIREVEFVAPRPACLKRVAAYARVSTGKDAMLHSLSAQVSYYSDMIQKHPGWLYCGVYADESMTGTKSDRDGFQRLLDACRNGKVDLVITKSISRFARNTVDLLRTVRELRDLNIDVYFEEQNIHTLSADGELMLTILASYAQEESRSASENQKWRVRKGFANGELLNWRFMLGYDIDKDEIRIDPAGAELVREIYRRFIDGESMSSIAKNMNKRGIVGVLGGKKWKAYHIGRILSNEKYTGNALLWKHYTNNHIEKKVLVNRGEMPMYYAEDTHPAIIDPETFARVQQLRKEIKTSSREPAPHTRCCFSGLIVCGQCGQKYRRIKNHQHFAWNCSTYIEHGKASCAALQIREDVLQLATAGALGLIAFDDSAVRERVALIEAKTGQILSFHLRDGSTVDVAWEKASRKSSWTPDMKKTAAERTRRQRRNDNGKGSQNSHDDPALYQPVDQAGDHGTKET